MKVKKSSINALFIITVMIVFEVCINANTVGTDKFVSEKAAICTGNQLSLKEVEGEGDMGGKVYAKFVFTNISSSICTISGFPEFVLLDKSGKVMNRIKFEHDSDKPSTVILEPKQTAWFQILYSTGMGYDLKKSPPSSTKVKVTIPKISKAFVIKSKHAPYKGITVYALKNGMPD